MSEHSPDFEAGRLVEHAEFLRRLARRLVRDEDRANELVQDTFVAALESGAVRQGSLRGWLTGVARNLARMNARTDIRRLGSGRSGVKKYGDVDRPRGDCQPIDRQNT